MVNKKQFEGICNKYGLDSKKIIENNKNVLIRADYNGICYVLDFLKDTLKITPNNIEKCPSILYLKIEAIKENYNFFKEKKLNMNDVETCLHILNTEPSQLKRTYEYVSDENRYGKRYIEQVTTILRVPVEKIQEIEEKCPELSKESMLNVASFRINSNEIKKIVEVCRKNKIELTINVFRQPAEEIEKVVEVCKKNKIELTGNVFKQPAEEIEKIVEVCRKNKIEITGSAFLKSAEEIEKIVEVCKENKIEITGSVFLKSAEEIEKIVEVCKKNKIELTGSVFKQTAEKIEENVEYIKQNYGEEYLAPLIVSKNKKNIEKTFPYLQEMGALEMVKTSASILLLTLEEIQERQAFIESIGQPFVKGNKFNSIFGMSRKNYQEKVKEFEEKKKLIGEIKDAIREGQELDEQINNKKQEQK